MGESALITSALNAFSGIFDVITNTLNITAMQKQLQIEEESGEKVEMFSVFGNRQEVTAAQAYKVRIGMLATALMIIALLVVIAIVSKNKNNGKTTSRASK